MQKLSKRIFSTLVIVGILAEVASLVIQIAQYINQPQIEFPSKLTVRIESVSK